MTKLCLFLVLHLIGQSWGDVTQPETIPHYFDASLFCFACFCLFFTGSCSSYVGMIGGAQKLSIGNGCNHKGIIIHQIGKIPSKHSKQEALN